MYSLRHDASYASPITKRYIYIYIYIFSLPEITQNAHGSLACAFSRCNGKAATDSVHTLLQPRILHQLLSGWYRKWYWLAPAQRLKNLVLYETKMFKKRQCIIGIHQNKQI